MLTKKVNRGWTDADRETWTDGDRERQREKRRRNFSSYLTSTSSVWSSKETGNETGWGRLVK